MKKYFYIFILISLIFLSCKSNQDKKILARVNEKILYEDDIKKVIPKNVKDPDFFKQKYINDWIRKELMISHAEMNLSSNLDKFEDQIEDYRSSLLIYAFQQEMLDKNLDLEVKDSKIKEYYDQNKEEFKLSFNIFKGRFIVLDKSAPDINEIYNLYKSKEIDDLLKLEDYCNQFSKSYSLNDTIWKRFSLVSNSLSNIILDEEEFLKNNSYSVNEKDNLIYFIYINDYMIKNDLSPIEVVFDKIKDVILNKRKVKYLEDLENKIYNNALNNNEIKIY